MLKYVDNCGNIGFFWNCSGFNLSSILCYFLIIKFIILVMDLLWNLFSDIFKDIFGYVLIWLLYRVMVIYL